MPKKIKNVFYKSLTFEKMIDAHNRAKKQKMSKNEVIKFEINLESNIWNLIKEIKNETYQVGKYNSFYVYEPKERLIHSLPYRDRVVHQWYVEEFIKPYIMPKFIYASFACLPEKGTHRAAIYTQQLMRKYQAKNPDYYVLKCDIKKYFYSIDINILIKILEKYISDKALLNFSKKIIVQNRPFDSSAGIPIGNYTSQYFANIYLNELDQFVKHTLHIHEYVRYMDDFLFLCPDKDSAIKLKETVNVFLNKKLHLTLNKKSKYFPSKMGVNFCGYRIFPTHMLLRNSSKRKIKRNIRKWNKKYREKTLNIERTMQRINSWKGHASHCNSFYLTNKIINKCDFVLNDRGYQDMYEKIIDDMNNFEKVQREQNFQVLQKNA